MKPITKRYTNGEVTVVWQPHLCIHSGICFRGLPGVFDPRRRPWVMPENGTTAEIVAQVGKCPSGALSMAATEGSAPAAVSGAGGDAAEVTRIEATPNGPFLVYGTALVRGGDGRCELRDGTTALCRCGGSSNKPFCDGSHAKIGFRG